ncbi:MAG TPA: triose-phosphate isomerase [Casimicrobiaceae bacterium]|nr:triose-phosphate isomerase [Casimicrobiaceae bacterium]
MRAKLVVGNWKMNGGFEANAALLDTLAEGWNVDPAKRGLAVCVPHPYLAQARDRLNATSVAWGAQDVSPHRAGAYTGDVSAQMVAEFGCRYAIVGHSERRAQHGESDALVASKARAVLDAGMTPIVCVGETLAERDAALTETVVGRQIDEVIERLGTATAKTVVAYEPVWAIGTGRTATPEQAQEVHALLRSRLSAAGAEDITLLYGGSVKGANAADLFAMPDVDGGLVGGASLSADEFLAIGLA